VFIYEAIAMAIFVFCINMSGSIIGVLLSLYVMIMWSYPVSGGHVNPAVTLGIYVKGMGQYKKNLMMCFIILLGEFAGAFGGAGVFLWITDDESISESAFKAQLYPRPGINVGKVFFIEMLGTGLFVLAVCLIKFSNTSRFISDNPALKVAFAVAMLGAVLNSCGPYTGGGINPAVGAA
jgi:glycerol uptake facilitator-like aquaporin